MANISYYFSIFLRRLPYFLPVALVIAAVSVIVAVALPPAYVSQMQLIVESSQIPGELAAPTAATPAQEQLQIVEQRLLTRANLLDIANRLRVLDDQEEMNPDQIVQAMRARTAIDSSSGRDEASLMTVSFEAGSGEKAAGVLNEYLTLIQQEDIESRTARAAQTLEFFEQEVTRLSAELAEKSAAILAFKTKNSEALPDSLDYRLGQQSQLQERLGQLDRDIFNLSSQRLRMIEVFKTTGQVEASRVEALTPEQQQLETLRAELSDALAVYSAENPRVKMLQARISQVEQIVRAQPVAEPEEAVETGNSMLDFQLTEIDTRLISLKEERATVDGDLKKIEATIKQTPANAIRLDELTLNYENIQLQYNSAVDRLAKASAGERIEFMARGQKISVIEPPATPNEPTKPNRLLIAGGGSVFGILAGLGLVVLLEVLNRSIRRPEDLVRALGVSPIATIPYVQTRGEVFARRGRKLIFTLLILVGVPAIVYAIHTFYQPLDLIAEQIMNKIGMRW
jgi:uncharacterized protein involved in exopolysaccharide biosynthesis